MIERISSSGWPSPHIPPQPRPEGSPPRPDSGAAQADDGRPKPGDLAEALPMTGKEPVPYDRLNPSPESFPLPEILVGGADDVAAAPGEPEDGGHGIHVYA